MANVLKSGDNGDGVRTIAVNTAWMLTAQLLKVVLQGIYFILVARALGAKNFGGFASVLAMVGIAVPFAGLGFGNLIVKNIAQDNDASNSALGNMLFMVATTGSLLTILLLSLKPFFLAHGISVWVLLMVALSDLIVTKIPFAVGFAFQAIDRLDKTSLILVILFVCRTIAAFTMLELVPHPTILSWSVFYLASSLAAALIAIVLSLRTFGLPHMNLRQIRKEFAEGFFFSASMSGQVINNNVDKIMLGRMSTLTATGIYGAAYRLIDVAMVPIRSLLLATYSRFFKHGKHGIRGSMKMALNLAPISAIYGTMAMIGIYFIAPIVPYVLGNEYSASVAALRWLSPIPLLKALHFVASDTLSGSGHQKLRSIMIFVAAFLNIALNLWLIPIYSWRGAAWASLASDGLLMVGLWLIVITRYKHDSNTV